MVDQWSEDEIKIAVQMVNCFGFLEPLGMCLLNSQMSAQFLGTGWHC